MATEKQVAALSDAVKSMQAQNEERWSSVERRLKALDAKVEEQCDTDRKSLIKIRDEILESIDSVEVPAGGGGSSQEEAPRWVKDGIEEVKGLAKMIIGDDPKTIEAIRDRTRTWIKGSKKAITGGGDD